MATLSTTDQKKSIEEISKETFYKSVANFMNQANQAALEDITTRTKIKNVTLAKRGGIPESHRIAADNLMIIRKVFRHPVVKCTLTSEEKELLCEYNFNPLEFSTAKQIDEELVLLKKWSNSREIKLEEASDKIINIRSKELRNLIATRYVTITSEVYNGYKTLEKYFETISKYTVER